jgi:serine/threonine-protein kinase
MVLPDLSRWPDADRLIDEALELPPDQREAFVGRAAGERPELAAALRAVLAEAGADDGFLAPGAPLAGVLAREMAEDPEPAPAPPVLAPGSRFGMYDILALAGRGGMGEVYKARDRRLGRIVALKLLPDAFARDPQRLGRFEREARLLASLTHPRIGAIHGLEEHEGQRALVLEWVDGATLADRLRRGALPAADVRELAVHLIDALEAAHERGVVHRDLKPANIGFARDGVKVLDFGLAKALDEEEPQVDPLSSPATGIRSVLGTAPYMSPEQARGERVDHRSDVWAFGCVLVEALSGRRAFPGDSPAAVIARVLEGGPDLDGLPADTPAALRRLVGRCLEKDPRRRLGWIGEARALLEEPVVVPALAPARGRRTGGGWPLALGAALAGAAIAGIVLWAAWRPAPARVARLAIPVTGGDELVAGDASTVAITADGGTVIYRARRDGVMRLFRRALDAGEAQPIAGTEHAFAPFVSPDARWVAFNRDGAVVKVPMEGGVPVTVARAEGAVVGIWTTRDTIVFGGDATGGLWEVPAAGGAEPRRLTSVDEAQGEVSHVLPAPAGGMLLFTVMRRDAGPELAVVAESGGAHRRIAPGRQPLVAGRDRLVFLREDSLWTARLDPSRGRLDGQPVPLPDRVDTSSTSGHGHYALSAGGTLVFLPRREARVRLRRVLWMDREGRAIAEALEPRPYTRAAVSPDGTRLALAVSGPDNRDLWVFGRAHGTLMRLTFEGHVQTAPLWTRDGTHLVFRADGPAAGLYRIRADGTGSPERLTDSGAAIHTPYDITPAGDVLLTEFRTYQDQAIGLLRAGARNRIEWLVDSPGADLRPRLSPDGRWMVYQSDESGRFEIYVRPYPRVNDGRWQVTTGGGTSPLWGRDGGEILFFNGGDIFSLPIALDGERGVRSGPAVRLFSTGLPADRLGPVFEQGVDGRLLMIAPIADTSAGSHLMVVTNWASGLTE